MTNGSKTRFTCPIDRPWRGVTIRLQAPAPARYRGVISLRPHMPAARVDLRVRIAAFFPPQTPDRRWGEAT